MLAKRSYWVLAAIIVALFAALVWVWIANSRPSDMTGIGLYAKAHTIHLPMEVSAVAPFMNQPIDAAALYQKAIAAYREDQVKLARYDQAKKTNAPEAQLWAPIVQLLIEASASSQPGVFGGRLADAINYHPDKPRIEALRSIGKAVLHLALLHNAENDKAVAIQHARAVFALGVKLHQERLVYRELDAGEELLGSSAALLATLEPDRASALRQFNEKRLEHWRTRIEPIHRAIFVVSPHVPDMAALAREAGDAMWQVEAILALGRCKYTAPRAADQKLALRTVTDLASSTDKRIAMAAELARDLTVEEFRTLR